MRFLPAGGYTARTLRPLISTEMWTHVNVFYNRARALEADDIGRTRVAALCALLRTLCQTHTGITEGTFYRDQGWCFYELGRYMERADQITRLVDIKYHTLLPPDAPVGSPFDVSQWNILLRAAGGYHAYRRNMPAAMSPASVAGFLLLSRGFPRSLTMCIGQMSWQMSQLRSVHGLRASATGLERLDELDAALRDQPIELILIRGLHEFLDWTQGELGRLQADIAGAFW